MSRQRIAASTVKIGNRLFSNYVVELADGKLTAAYPLTEELPFTEWREELIIKEEDI